MFTAPQFSNDSTDSKHMQRSKQERPNASAHSKVLHLHKVPTTPNHPKRPRRIRNLSPGAKTFQIMETVLQLYRNSKAITFIITPRPQKRRRWKRTTGTTRRLGGSWFVRGSSDQLMRWSETQRVIGWTGERVRGSANHRIRGPADQRVRGSKDQRD